VRLDQELEGMLPRRDDLRRIVTEALVADSRVEVVGLIGSLHNGKSDAFSDIDLEVGLRRGVVDREFFLDLPRVLGDVGSTVPGWGFHALPETYVATFHFDDYPLFWSVDIACVGDVHVDGSDLIFQYRWEQIYKVWLLAAKYIARGQLKLAEVWRLVERHVSVELVPSAEVERLAALLDGIERRKIDRGDPYEGLHRRCVELANDLRTLTEHRSDTAT